ncbi:MAG: hypothetical protein FWE90_08325 [Defluviitaleaceae bacterium]|nr:hypothetical protein [Defluviitaleaceae bacterium]
MAITVCRLSQVANNTVIMWAVSFAIYLLVAYGVTNFVRKKFEITIPKPIPHVVGVIIAISAFKYLIEHFVFMIA